MKGNEWRVGQKVNFYMEVVKGEKVEDYDVKVLKVTAISVNVEILEERSIGYPKLIVGQKQIINKDARIAKDARLVSMDLSGLPEVEPTSLAPMTNYMEKLGL